MLGGDQGCFREVAERVASLLSRSKGGVVSSRISVVMRNPDATKNQSMTIGAPSSLEETLA